MKTIYRIAILTACAALALSAVSCSKDKFDLYPSDSIQIQNYGRNDTEVTNVFLSAYTQLRSLSSSIIQLNGLTTDEAYDYKKNNSTGQIELNESTWDATCGTSSGIWSTCYTMIHRCNYALDHLDMMTAEGKKQIEGEAKYLRAYAYFTLVRLFGAVPLTTSVITNYKDLYNYDRESTDKIWSLIDSDLDTAVANLPESYDAKYAGRATKFAALATKAEAQMTRKNFSGAETTLKQIVNYSEANPKKLGLEDHVKDIYDSTNPNGKEIILAAHFNNGATQITNGFMGACYLAVTSSEKQSAYIYPDGTKSTIPGTIGNSTFLMTFELWNALRLNGGDRFTDLANASVYTELESIPSDEVPTKVVGGKNMTLMPNSMKYFDFQNEGGTKALSGCDNILYRYGGILLMYAECLNENGKTTEAINYLNMIRGRAHVGDTAAKTQAEVRQAIEDENFLELNFEGHRWYDLLRTDRLTPVMEAHFAHRTPGLEPTTQASDNGMQVNKAEDKTGTPGNWKWSGKSEPILFPIPYAQIQLCPQWVQNPLY